MKKFNTSNEIQKLYKAIKKDDINFIKNIVKDFPYYLRYNNQYGGSLLSYALNSNAINISKFLLSEYFNTLHQKNTHVSDILLHLINKNNITGIGNLLSLLNNDEMKELYNIKRVEPIIFTAVKKLNEKSWNLFYHAYKEYFTNKDISYTYNNGLNIAHLIAAYNKEHCIDFLKTLPNSVFYAIDNDSGSNPFLLACQYADENLLRFFFNHSDIFHETFLKSNAMHSINANEDANSFSLILNSHINHTNRNLYGHTPLMSAIVEKSCDYIEKLYPYYNNIDLSDELIAIFKSFSSLESLTFDIISTINDKNLSGFKDNPEKICQLFTAILNNCNEHLLDCISSNIIVTLLDEIKDDEYYMHQLYSATIFKRKFMTKKINFLLDKGDILHANDSNEHYSPVYYDNELYFNNIYDDEKKSQKDFCFVSHLGSLPISQIKNILDKTCVAGYFNGYDILLLLSIGIKKNSIDIVDFAKEMLDTFIHTQVNIEQGSNYALSIEYNLGHLTSNENREQFYQCILPYFNYIPSNCLSYITEDIIEHSNPIYELKEIHNIFKNKNDYKKNINCLLIENALAHSTIDDELFKKINENPALLFYVFKKIIIEKPDVLQFNSLFNHIVEHPEFNDTAKNWKFIFSIAQSNNPQKELLVKKLFTKTHIINKSDFIVFQGELSNYSVDDKTWKNIFSHVFNSNYLQPILNQYLFLVSSNATDIRLNTLLLSAKYIEDKFTNTHMWMTNVINHHSNNQEISVVFEKLFLNKHSIEELIDISIENSNFSYVEHLLTYKNASFKNISLDKFWDSPEMNQSFELSFIKIKYPPLSDYLLFIENNHASIDIIQINMIMEKFLNWYIDSTVDQKTKIHVTHQLFDTLKNNISSIDDKILINICSVILQNNNYSEENFNNFNNTNYINDVVSIIFSNKNDDFFNHLQKNSVIKDNTSILDNDNSKILNYHYLKDILKEPHIENKKKINKI